MTIINVASPTLKKHSVITGCCTAGTGTINTDFMEQARETVSGDFYILPSSKHEVVIMPQLNVPSVTELKNTVNDINESEGEPENRLTKKHCD